MLSIFAMIYTVVSQRRLASRENMRRLEDKVNEKASAMDVAAINGKVGLIEDRCIRLESDMQHMPDRKQMSTMELAVSDLKGQISTLNERIRPVSAMAERMTEAMIEAAMGKERVG